MKTKHLARAALIAAVYVALGLLLAPAASQVVQVRVSEALTLLVVLCPEAIVGVTIGCFLVNMFTSAPIDMVIGTSVTLLAALLSYRLRGVRFGRAKLPLAASLPPVLLNAVIVGAELTILYTPGAGVAVWAFNMATVGLGQLVSCTVLGCLLVAAIERNKGALRVLTQ